jgi:hypothetical protein
MATASATLLDAKMAKSPGKLGIMISVAVFIAGMSYAGISLGRDLSGIHAGSWLPYILLGIALLVALGFEFVNGFHDTANAVATVIYTHSLEPHIAVVWSGFCNFLGVLVSSGAIAFTIISLLPVELILQVGSKAGFAMRCGLHCRRPGLCQRCAFADFCIAFRCFLAAFCNAFSFFRAALFAVFWFFLAAFCAWRSASGPLKI